MNGRRTTTLRALVSPAPMSSALACLFVICLACLVPPSRAAKPPKAALKKSDARKLVAAYSLLELGKGEVGVKEITPGETSATVTAVVRVGFRFERDAKGAWRAVEMRVGDRQWEDLDLLSRAVGDDSLARSRAALDSFAAELDALALAKKRRDDEKKRAERDKKSSRGDEQAVSESASEDAAKKQRGGKRSDKKAAKAEEKSKKSDEKTAGKGGPPLARGALSVKNPEAALSPMGKSAVVEAEIEAAFDVVREGGAWRVASVRVGGVKLPDPEALARALDAEKRKAARADLEALATALESFRRERGFYVVADTEAALVDFLNPRYTASFIRVDPWHRPYEYKGTRDAFTLRSIGPDGKANTADDVTVEKPEARQRDE